MFYWNSRDVLFLGGYLGKQRGSGPLFNFLCPQLQVTFSHMIPVATANQAPPGITGWPLDLWHNQTIPQNTGWPVNYLGHCLHKAVKFGLLLSYIPLYPVFYFIFKYFCILTKLSSEKPLNVVSASDQQHVDTLREKRDLQKRETYRKHPFCRQKSGKSLFTV